MPNTIVLLWEQAEGWVVLLGEQLEQQELALALALEEE
jgi:hypothetical protein